MTTAEHPTALIWTGHVEGPSGRWSVGYSAAGVWAVAHGDRGVAGVLCRTPAQVRRTSDRHPHLSRALTVAWELYSYAPAMGRYHREEAPVRASVRPEEVHP